MNISFNYKVKNQKPKNVVVLNTLVIIIVVV